MDDGRCMGVRVRGGGRWVENVRMTTNVGSVGLGVGGWLGLGGGQEIRRGWLGPVSLVKRLQ